MELLDLLMFMLVFGVMVSVVLGLLVDVVMVGLVFIGNFIFVVS